jgi:bifunctional UDP-N-acetylglucosamine pyrophosphorylase/glucosamine-1-phosphate N-acetyltransferase
MLTMNLVDPSGYGRFVKNERGEVLRIVEHRDVRRGKTDCGDQYRDLLCRWRLLFSALARSPTTMRSMNSTDGYHRDRTHGKTESRIARRSRCAEAMGINSPDDLRKAVAFLQEKGL